MRPIHSFILAAVGASALAGTALAASRAEHVLDLRLPDGGVAHIRYIGDVAPKVVLVPAPAMAPMPIALFGADPFAPFAALDRVAAEMDARADAMMREAARVAALPGGGMTMVSGGALAPGTSSYSVVSTTINGKTCTRSLRLTAGKPGAAVQRISQTSGDCDAATPTLSGGGAASAPVPPGPRVTPVRAEAPRPAVKPGPTI
jgi:hypothetical protein